MAHPKIIEVQQEREGEARKFLAYIQSFFSTLEEAHALIPSTLHVSPEGHTDRDSGCISLYEDRVLIPDPTSSNLGVLGCQFNLDLYPEDDEDWIECPPYFIIGLAFWEVLPEDKKPGDRAAITLCYTHGNNKDSGWCLDATQFSPGSVGQFFHMFLTEHGVAPGESRTVTREQAHDSIRATTAFFQALKARSGSPSQQSLSSPP